MVKSSLLVNFDHHTFRHWAPSLLTLRLHDEPGFGVQLNVPGIKALSMETGKGGTYKLVQLFTLGIPKGFTIVAMENHRKMVV